MKGKSLLILLLVALGFGVYLYYGVQKPAEEKEKRADSENKLVTGDLSLLTTLVVKAKDHPTMKLEKSGRNWKILEPLKDLAAQNKVETLVSAIERFKKTKV